MTRIPAVKRRFPPSGCQGVVGAGRGGGLRIAGRGLRIYSVEGMLEKEGPDFGKLAVALGFLTQEDLEKILQLQADLHKIGVDRRMGELCLEKRFLSREQVLLVLRAQGKRIMSCHACQKSYNVHHYRATETYTCKHCTAELSLPTKPV